MLAQLARASRLHREGRGFEPLTTHQKLEKEPQALYLISDRCRLEPGVRTEQSEVPPPPHHPPKTNPRRGLIFYPQD